MNHNLMQSVDERTRLAGTNRLEVLLFSLGVDAETQREEIFGINVFKVKEVMHAPEITRAPDMPDAVEGMVNLRGETVPVVNLQKFCGIEADRPPAILIVTEYNKHMQGFLVHSVDSIKRLAWADVKAPPSMIANRHSGLVTAVTEVSDGDERALVMIMDVERVLSETAGFYDDESLYQGIESQGLDGCTILFADDSSIARKQIRKTLDRMGVNYISTVNGQEAWDVLGRLADESELTGQPLSEKIWLVLTDIEMPEMDGYVLTRKIKGDDRFSGIPVVMHSSLTAESNQALGESIGADAYVAKFAPLELAATLYDIMRRQRKAASAV